MFRTSRAFQTLTSPKPARAFLLSAHGVRNAVTVSAVKPESISEPVFSSSEEGFRLASLSQPALWSGSSRVAIVFKAGPKYEMDCKDHGITHLIRRACGLSTADYTAVNLTRHFQQMGARVNCTTTREHMIYTVDVAPNLLERAGRLLAEVATGSVFYEWELKETANRLMRQDIELLNRHDFAGVSMELLHEAAYGRNPLGCGLGNSLFSTLDRVGSYTLEQLENFHQHFFTPANCSMALVGLDSQQDGLALLREIKANLHVRAPRQVPEKHGKTHGFVGGDIRRSIAAAPRVYAKLAWPTTGNGTPESVAFDVAANLLTGSNGRIPYTSGVNQTLASTSPDSTADVQACHKSYSEHGLFGLSVKGACASDVNDALCHAVSSLFKLQVTDKDLAQAKASRKADILMEFENPGEVAIDLALQAYDSKGGYKCPQTRAAAVDSVTVSQVNEALKKISSSKAALSVVGPEANTVLPLSVLLSP